MDVIHHGGKMSVTGSCHEVCVGQGADKKGILIDCGLFQGKDKSKAEAGLEVNFAIEHIKALLLTHSHIDHIGRLPWLLAAGFHGPIYCTPATAELVPLMIEDGLRLQLGLNPQQISRVLSLIKKRIRAVDYNRWFRIPSFGHARFQHAGHILGSAYIELKLPVSADQSSQAANAMAKVKEKTVVFSGDLGSYNTPLLPDPISPKRADILYIESTYGNKCHDNIAQREQRLGQVIDHALDNGGVIVIPAFSVGRTQELLFDLENLLYQRRLSHRLPIILDSPLATKITQSYRRFAKLWGREARQRLDAQRHPLAFEQCVVIESHREHQRVVNRLASSRESAIVVAASGMCQGGRVMSYLKALLPDPRNDVLFAGYQARGTLGAEIQRGEHYVDIDGESIKVAAQIHSISGYSAHAGQDDLIRFIDGIAKKPQQIHLIHGEAHAKSALSQCLKRKGYAVYQ